MLPEEGYSQKIAILKRKSFLTGYGIPALFKI